MRFLVTGGSGFIGSSFIHHLLHAHAGVDWRGCCPDHARYETPADDPGLEVLNVDKLTYAGDPANLAGVDAASGYRFARADICDAPVVGAIVREYAPDVIVHFAAESHVDRSIASGDAFARTNVLGTQVLLDAARRFDVPRFLHVSTDEVYGSVEKGSFRERDPLDPSSPYSATKAGSDLLVLAHHRTYGTRAQITRCTNNYGPRQHPEKLLPNVLTKALRGEPVSLYGTGMNVRDWLYVKDHCSALLRVLGEARWGEVYNVGGRDERTNLEVVKLALRAVGGSEDLIRFVADRPGHDWRYSLDDSKLRALGWSPRVRFDDGIEATLRWLTRARPAEVAAPTASVPVGRAIGVRG